MIQALNTKNFLSQASGEAGVIDPELMLESGDFANELMANMLGQGEEEAVVASELLVPGQAQPAINPEAIQPDTIIPKNFDPALTKGVEDLIQPKSAALTDAEVLKLANGEVPVKPEVAQALLKTPQVQTGRAPAIDFAKSEIDPQLMNMEDFVGQKNLLNKKGLQSNAYGIGKPQAQQVALENGLKSTEVVKDIGALENASSSPMNSQQFILNMMSEQNESKVEAAQAPQKIFDMSNIKSSNPTQIMTQITDYIVQAKAAKEPTVNMRVNHEQLGMIDITVQKAAGVNQEAVAINIGAHTADGKNFFQQNSKDLLGHLSQSGINVSDFKVDTSSQTAKNDFDMGQQSGRGFNGQEKQFNSEHNQRKHESDRRQELWNLLQDKEAA